MLTSSPSSSLHSKALSFTRPALIFQPNPNSQFLHFHSSHHSLAGAPVKRWPSIVAMSKSPKVEEQKFSVEGLVTESLGNGMFRIELDNADTVIGYISGRIRKSFIRVLPGDRVRVEVSRYDTTRGRIVYRLRNAKDSPPS